MSLWPEWMRPLWLLAVPLLVWLLWRLWHRKRQTGRWQQLLPTAFHAPLLKGGDGRGSRLPWVLLASGWLITMLALLGPSWQQIQQSNQKPLDPLVVVLDMTPRMLASDVSPNRLDAVRRKVLDLLGERTDRQTGIVLYAGSAHALVPLSDDLATSRNLIEALKPSLMPVPGHRADLGVQRAVQMLEQAQLGRGRIVLITSAVDAQERAGIVSALKRYGASLSVLGVGTREGGPVNQEDGSFLKADNGSILITRLETGGLQQLARDTSARFTTLQLSDQDLRRLGLLDPPQALHSLNHALQLDARIDQGYWLLLPLLLLAACAGRRGWLLCLPVLLFTAQPSHAFEFDDLWWRADQQGARLLMQQRPAEAAEKFLDPLWQGKALFDAGDYAAAAERFAQGNLARDHYNRGTALAKAGELEAALDAYEQALELQADFPAAEHNKALVEQALKQRDEQPAQSQSSEQTPDQDEASQAANHSASPANTDARTSSASQSGEKDSQASSPSQPENPTPAPADAAQSQGAELPAEAPPQVAQGDEYLGSTDAERQQAMEQWLRQIPDDPGELLKRKFWYEQQQRQERPQ